jgi:hypothetical protein
MKKYTLQHTGFPTTRAIREDEWKTISTHGTASAAWKRTEKLTAHLSQNTWDDHFRVVAPDGTICRYDEYLNDLWVAKAMKE